MSRRSTCEQRSKLRFFALSTNVGTMLCGNVTIGGQAHLKLMGGQVHLKHPPQHRLVHIMAFWSLARINDTNGTVMPQGFKQLTYLIEAAMQVRVISCEF
mmetsp:Transcript_37917/g.62702  ORF Transcript_37917/g.62702 Transcript_37917/m.62702 type:complete len:100 (+) Transcript_37917:63-362(+)